MVNSWQDNLSTWKRRLTAIHDQKYLSDCAFILNDGPDRFEIKAHKMILASCSSEFQNLYFSCGATDNEIIVHDVTPAALTLFVEYIYKETIILTIGAVWDVLKLSRLYAVKSLERFCASFLEKSVNKDHVLTILDKSSVHRLDLVKAKCMDVISRLTIEIYQEPAFYAISAKTLKVLLSFDKLPGKEIEIYRAVNKWSEVKCEKGNLKTTSANKKTVLKNCLDEIRFCSMTSEEFNSCVEDSLLPKDDIIDIFRNISSSGASSCKFSSLKRLSNANNNNIATTTAQVVTTRKSRVSTFEARPAIKGINFGANSNNIPSTSALEFSFEVCANNQNLTARPKFNGFNTNTNNNDSWISNSGAIPKTFESIKLGNTNNIPTTSALGFPFAGRANKEMLSNGIPIPSPTRPTFENIKFGMQFH